MDFIRHEFKAVSEFKESVVVYEFTIRLYAPSLKKIVDFVQFWSEFRFYPLGVVCWIGSHFRCIFVLHFQSLFVVCFNLLKS